MNAFGAVSAPGPYYGFTAFVLHGTGDTLPQNQDYDDLMEIDVRRLDENLDEVGSWNVAGICCSNVLLAHMRDFAAHADGIYTLDFPFDEFNPGWDFGLEHPTDFRMEVENMLTADDTLVIGVQFDGAAPIRRATPDDTFSVNVTASAVYRPRHGVFCLFWSGCRLLDQMNRTLA